MPAPSDRTDKTKERDVEISVRDSFPASDPSSATSTQGSRAVPFDEGDAQTPRIQDPVTLYRRFPDPETAKLAMETLVRRVPLDPDCTTLAGNELRLHVPRADAARIEGLLQAA
ncbi:hypothetical protein [Falsiroseomonas selenitidurans]|uniref:Uncharacterized protein n=1 Tax=Falsiroseomonas selenitidurans TaxID=2716335 RepID=A0ABX1E539_9PROT|nr:hypothetical protein [Falsiroseomonas selenitidurans]NKC32314.1 hypothetical protein [Falsiroseomonas selenitidurans]